MAVVGGPVIRAGDYVAGDGASLGRYFLRQAANERPEADAGIRKARDKSWVPWVHAFIALAAVAITAFIMFKIAQWSGLSKSFNDGIGVG
jgi:hypothetical protein